MIVSAFSTKTCLIKLIKAERLGNASSMAMETRSTFCTTIKKSWSSGLSPYPFKVVSPSNRVSSKHVCQQRKKGTSENWHPFGSVSAPFYELAKDYAPHWKRPHCYRFLHRRGSPYHLQPSVIQLTSPWHALQIHTFSIQIVTFFNIVTCCFICRLSSFINNGSQWFIQ